MFLLDDEQKIELVNELQKKASIVNFKYRCIKSNFQNMKKYTVDQYCYFFPDLKNLSMNEILQLEKFYKDTCEGLNSIAKKRNIDIFEDQDINHFIQYYNVSFIKEKKTFFLIEI